MPDYASLKVPELKKLLQEKSLPVTGNKADLISRLQEHDKSQSSTTVRENEDEIDYSDDEVTTAAKPEEEAKPADPVAPSAAEEKPVEASEPVKEEVETDAVAEQPAETAIVTEDTTKPEAPKIDFSAHLPASNADEEARKRAERAKRFGIVENDEDKKKAARTERFGVDDSSLVKGLDDALPEKRPSKRGREGNNADGERAAKRQTPGGRRGGKGRFRHGGGGRAGGGPRKEAKPTDVKGRSGIQNDPKEKAKAEARAKRFGGGGS
ncbi:uncharacterized protein F4822DRAFT_161842 [Hypoxylon trugodes]|uniref:uncharacterized protein n=1 Tax=Hypoxylon trugodes TaxID=326681 RepID=UPI0021A1694F|nr:uncharacterized protein F4822DRAFT_161842 [Hypoxylon trugodes]KAI1390710.1 hypothetical protein F4822DRAFT_161842 [Hypoxylon trugodes]